MLKKTVFVALQLLVLNIAVYGDSQWTDGAAENHLWSDPANWGWLVPDETISAEIWKTGIYGSGQGPTVETTAYANNFKFRNGDVNIVTGGTLYISGWGDIGTYQNTEPDFPGLATMTISGTGAFHALSTSSFHVGDRTDGQLVMKDNALFDINATLGVGNNGAVGHIQLKGGLIDCENFWINNGSSMDITGGTLRISSDSEMPSRISGYEDSGLITAYGGLGELVIDYNSISDVTTVTAVIYEKAALDPDPPDGAADASRHTALSWMPGGMAAKHNIYFGTNFEDVNSANDPHTPPGRGQQALDANSYDPGELEFASDYYWRIDEVNGPNTWRGDLWSFTTTNKADADFNIDGSVDFPDYAALADKWLSAWDDPGFDEVYDLYADDSIDAGDLGFFSRDWLQQIDVDAEVYVYSANTVNAEISDLLLGINMSYWRDTDQRWDDGKIAGYLADIDIPAMRFPGGG